MDSGPLLPPNKILHPPHSSFPAELTRTATIIEPAFTVQDSLLREYWRVLLKRK